MSTILLVDDVELFLELERSHLEGRGYGIATATSGEQALARLEEVRPDLVLLDLYMPDMNGDEVCRRIRSRPEWERLPVIMVTAAGKPAEIGKCLDAGCDDYITKPVNKQDLLEKVQRLLGKVRRRTSERRPFAIQVEVSAGGRNFTSYARDLSRNGIYIRSSSALAVNTAVELQLQFPEGRELKLMGRVKRVEAGGDGADDGMGIYFILPDDAARAELDRLIAQGEKRDEPPKQTGSLEQQLAFMSREKARLEKENRRLAARVDELEAENREFAEHIVQIEEINNNLSNLYIASSRLHSVLDRRKVLEIIKEIVINFVGAERFAILTLDRDQQRLVCEAGEGVDAEGFEPVGPGEGCLGQVFEDKEIFLRTGALSSSADESGDPLAVVPLAIGDDVLGLLVIYDLFVQKNRLEEIDHQLFSMLGEHAATALFSATLHEETERKRATYKGFMDLLLK